MKRKIICIILVLALLLSGCSLGAGSTSGTITWKLDNGTLTISGSGPMEDYESSAEEPWHKNWYSITNAVIEEGVTSIGGCTFAGCGNLTSVTIPKSVTSIGERAFLGCDSLTSVTIPGSVATIGQLAFYSCSSLTSVIIGDGVTSIQSNAFYYCASLASVTIPESVTSIEALAFGGCPNLTDVYYGGSEGQWNQIEIDSNNDPLHSATIHFGS